MNGGLLGETSSPITYDKLSQMFTVYTENNAFIGENFISVRGFLADYPSMTSSVPNEQTIIRISDPCSSEAVI